MKGLYVLILSIIFFAEPYAQSVAINSDGSVANASAILDVKSAVKGMLLPRTSTSSMLSEEKILISNQQKQIDLLEKRLIALESKQ